MERAFEQLRREVDAEPGSFLLALRCDLEWSKPACLRLVALMEDFVDDISAPSEAERGTIERWAAAGLWYVNGFVEDRSSHQNFPRVHGGEYHQRAEERRSDLAFRLFADQGTDRPCRRPPFEWNSSSTAIRMVWNARGK